MINGIGKNHKYHNFRGCRNEEKLNKATKSKPLDNSNSGDYSLGGSSDLKESNDLKGSVDAKSVLNNTVDKSYGEGSSAKTSISTAIGRLGL